MSNKIVLIKTRTYETSQSCARVQEVKLIFAYNKRAFFWTFLRNKQTNKLMDGKCGLQSCMSQLKIEKIFRGKLYKLIVSYYVLINKRIMLLTGTVPALKNRFLGYFCVTDVAAKKIEKIF